MGRAFPLLLDKSIQQAQRSVLATENATSPPRSQDEACMLAWAQQAMAKGLIGPFLHKLVSQPQVATAYSPEAPVRNRERLQAIASLLQSLQGPLSKLQNPASAAPSAAAPQPPQASAPSPSTGRAIPPPASSSAPHIQTDEEVLAQRKQQVEATSVRRQRGWWGYKEPPEAMRGADVGGAGTPGAGEPAAAAPHGRPSDGEARPLAGRHGAAGGSQPTAAAAAAPTALSLGAFSLWGVSSSSSSGGGGGGGGGGGAAPSTKRSKAAPGASPTLPGPGPLPEPASAAATPHPLTRSLDPGTDTKDTQGPAKASASGQSTESALLTASFTITQDPEHPVALMLSVNQQQQAPAGYSGWFGARLVPFRLWGPAPPGGAAAAPAAGPAAAAAADGKGFAAGGRGSDGGGDAAAAAAADNDSKAAAAAGEARGRGDGGCGAVSLVIDVLPNSDSDRLLTVTLAVQPETSSSSSGGGSSSVSWVYGAASSMGKLVDPVAWARAYVPSAGAAPALARKPEPAKTSGTSSSDGGARRPAGDDQTAGSSQQQQQLQEQQQQVVPGSGNGIGGDSDEDGDLGMLEDMRLVLGGGFDPGPDGHGAFSPPRRNSDAGEPEGAFSRRSAGAAGGAAASEPPASAVQRSASGHRSTNTIRLVLDATPLCPQPQQLQNQAGQCAGCSAALAPPQQPQPPRPTSGSYFWPGSAPAAAAAAAGPRTCWYTGKLYCQQCHHGQVAVIPGRVLHKWDFVPRPVCCAAQDYLASICDQPVLCVTAINPGLLAKVTQLAEAHGLRQRLRTKLAAAQQGGHGAAVLAIKKAAGSRGYLLGEMEDFWSLADLIELSKGPLSTLSKWLTTVETDVAALNTA